MRAEDEGEEEEEGADVGLRSSTRWLKWEMRCLLGARGSMKSLSSSWCLCGDRQEVLSLGDELDSSELWPSLRVVFLRAMLRSSSVKPGQSFCTSRNRKSLREKEFSFGFRTATCCSVEPRLARSFWFSPSRCSRASSSSFL